MTFSSVNPLTILLACVLPMYAEDAKDMVVRILQQAREKGEEIDVQDGFDLYKELAETRQIYADALPGYASSGFTTLGRI